MALALSCLKLFHFRSYKSAELVLDAGPVALFGRNGAGKTNVLEAISLLSPGRGIRRASSVELAQAPERLGWKITAKLENLGQLHEVTTWAEPDTPRQVHIDDKAASQLALGRLARMVWLVPSMDRLWLEGADGRRRFLDRMALSLYPAHGEVSLAYEKAMRERNRLLKDGINDTGWYHALETQMAVSGVAIIENRKATLVRLAKAQANAETAFPTATLTLTNRDGAGTPETQSDLEAAFQQGRSRDMAAGRSLTGPHRGDLGAVYAAKGVAAKLCSTGEQKALLISLILANARALAAEFGAPPIILLDEVAAHLDQSRRAALYDEICGLKAQAWMTGTESSLFDGLAGRARLLEVVDDNGYSTIKEATRN